MKINWVSMLSAAALTLGFAVPASAQMTYNFATGGNCNFPPATCTVTGSGTVASDLAISGWAAASGANFVAATITDQTTSGIGMSFTGEATTGGNHGIDNSGQSELVLLNFGTNKVVLTGLATGWSYNDTDISVLRWTGSTGPDLTTTKVTDSVSGLVAKGWSIVSSIDLDGSATGTGATFGLKSGSTGVAATAANSSSWWIVSSYFGGAGVGETTEAKDYFKLLSISATCTGSTVGNGTCNATPTPPVGVPEPTSLALAGLALAGVGFSRRRKSAK